MIGRDASGGVAGFFHLAVSRPAARSRCRRCPACGRPRTGSTNGWSAETVAWATQHGFERVSLNFSPFAAVLAPDAELSASAAGPAQACSAQLKGTFQLDNLLAFNRKFFPQWQKRYVVFERFADLPRVGIAGLAAEGYLRFVGQRR